MHCLYRILSAVLAAAFFAAAAPAAPVEVTKPATVQFRREQSARLAAAGDRDSRIAAALLALPREAHVSGAAAADASAAQTLLQPFGDDELALYVAALACHLSTDCKDTSAVERLTARAPGNAVHWLLRPGMGALSEADLRSAAAAKSAAPHLSELSGILQQALRAAQNVTERDDALDALPMPRLSPLLELCRNAQAARRDACITVGRTMLNDARGSILSRMIGGVALRRLAQGTADEAAAVAFRRAYVWLGEHEAIRENPHDETLRADLQRYGEWEALQRAADRAGIARTPPADWKAKNPQQLLLPEQRSAAGN